MKSTEVYKAAREVIAPWCKMNGFKRTSGGMLGWFKPIGNSFIVFWFQCSQDGWDAHAGSSFCVEFQFSSSPYIGAGGCEERHRLPYFLGTGEKEDVRQINNRIMAKLEYPPNDHFFQMSDNVANWYRKKFAAVEKGNASQNDIWLSYKDEKDVVIWAEFILCSLAKVLTYIASL